MESISMLGAAGSAVFIVALFVYLGTQSLYALGAIGGVLIGYAVSLLVTSDAIVFVSSIVGFAAATTIFKWRQRRVRDNLLEVIQRDYETIEEKHTGMGTGGQNRSFQTITPNHKKVESTMKVKTAVKEFIGVLAVSVFIMAVVLPYAVYPMTEDNRAPKERNYLAMLLDRDLHVMDSVFFDGYFAGITGALQREKPAHEFIQKEER